MNHSTEFWKTYYTIQELLLTECPKKYTAPIHTQDNSLASNKAYGLATAIHKIYAAL